MIRVPVESKATGRAVTDPAKRAMLLAALYIAQEQYGWLSPEAIQRVADRLQMSPGHVLATASFYTMYKMKPEGHYHFQVCEGLSCYLVGGAETLIDYIAECLEVKPGERSQDGKFSLEVVQCLAACGTSPAVKVNDELYEHMTQEKIDELVRSLREL